MYLDPAADRIPRTISSRPTAPVRVAVLDDHAAVRAGLQAMLDREPDLVAVGAASSEQELWPLLERTSPALVVLDLDHPGRSGLALSVLIKRRPPAPRIVLYSGTPAEPLAVAARFAGADAVVEKADSSRVLLEAIRDAARGNVSREPLPPRLLRPAAARLDTTQRAILAMRLAGTSPAEVARILGLPAAEIVDRSLAILGLLTDRSGARPAESAARPLSVISMRAAVARHASRIPSERELVCAPA